MSKKSSWVKKRHSETAQAKAQQRHRRKRGLFKKAAEFWRECESEVFLAVQVRKTGQMHILNSSSRSQWLHTLANLTSCFPLPIQETMEDIIPQICERSSDRGGDRASTGNKGTT
ncbi:hypothetical protein BDV23DRAFT_186822 [Aspergillus alliaceus]|uniref:Uncharacterized protein n=1 Tax=Petromyces alliaceus TaxID=209559 RepID=A0A5N7BYN4_PETAA|nr:hypothetical protein BDV23DRAFT_186822 [Aspergillus alliaceus]